jgi:hypothetical protein
MCSNTNSSPNKKEIPISHRERAREREQIVGADLVRDIFKCIFFKRHPTAISINLIKPDTTIIVIIIQPF